MLFLLIINFFTISVIPKIIETDYCFIKCLTADTRVHEVCRSLHKCIPSIKCLPYEADQKFRETILDWHNEHRNMIASGFSKGQYGNTGAKNMHALSYDLELEFIAGCSNLKCDLIERKGCFDTERFTVFGRNFFNFNHNPYINLPRRNMSTEYVVALNDGFTPGNTTDVNDIHSYKPDTKNLQFLRMMFAESKYVGCAVTMNRFDFNVAVKCLYGPADYKEGQPIYKMALNPSEIASECKEGKNEIYESLCGKIDPLPKEKMWRFEPNIENIENIDNASNVKFNQNIYFAILSINILMR